MEVANWVREGAIDELKQWLEESNVKENPDDEGELAAIRRGTAFGQNSFTLGMSLLLWAVDTEEIGVEKKIQMCSLLLKYYPTLINHSGPDKATPLHYASGSGNIQLIHFLLERGAKILLDDKNETPLHWACLNGMADAVRVLLQSGANPNDRSIDGKTGLHYAVINKHNQVVSILLSDPRIDAVARREAREIAVQKGQKSLIQLFDPEKREILVVVQEKQKILEEYKEKIRTYEQRKEADQVALEIAYNNLAEEEASHRRTKELIDDIREQARSRAITDHEQRYNDLKREYTAIRRQNSELQQQLAELRLKQSSDQRLVDVRVSDVHRNLSSLLSMLDTTNIAIVSAKTSLENVRPYLRMPRENK